MASGTAVASECEVQAASLRADLDRSLQAVAPLEAEHKELWDEGVRLRQSLDGIRFQYAPLEGAWAATRSRYGYVAHQLGGMEAEFTWLLAQVPWTPPEAQAREARLQYLRWNAAAARAELAHLETQALALQQQLEPAWSAATDLHLELQLRSGRFFELAQDIGQRHLAIETTRAGLQAMAGPQAQVQCKAEELQAIEADTKKATDGLATLNALREKATSLATELKTIRTEVEAIVGLIGLEPG